MKIIDELVDCLKQLNQPVILAGAGISIGYPSNLPSGLNLIDNILSHCVLPEYLDETKKLMNAPKVSDEVPGKFLRFEYLMSLVRGYDKNLSVFDCIRNCNHPNLNHYLLANLILNGYTVITTNFDDLIEVAYSRLKSPHDKTLEVKAYDNDFDFEVTQVVNDKKNFLWKIHGSIIRDGKNISDSIQAEYTSILKNHNSLKLEFLSQILKVKDLVVVGYSGSDDFDIIPTIAETHTDKKIVWIQHHFKQKNIKEELIESLKTIRSHFHTLGIYRILDFKETFIQAFFAPTTRVLYSLQDANLKKISCLLRTSYAYNIPSDFFSKWAKNLNVSDIDRYDLTYNLHFASGKKISIPEYIHTPQQREDLLIHMHVKELINLYNEGIRSFEVLSNWLIELEELDLLYGLSIPNILNLKACIKYDLYRHDEAFVDFKKLLEYYKQKNDLQGITAIYNALNSRDLASNEEKEKLNKLINELGFYPYHWRQKYSDYVFILSSVFSYQQLVYEIGGIPGFNYTEAVNELLAMKRFAIIFGDEQSEINIDRLLFTLDYYDEGIRKDFSF